MASKTTLTAQNLESLGAAALARLLMEVSAGDALLKRRLRMELTRLHSPADLAKEVRKRLLAIGRSRGFVDWSKVRALAEDLEIQRKAITGQVVKSSPAEALELLWRFLALAGSVYERCDDSGGLVGEVFAAAREDLGAVAQAARPEPEALAAQVLRALLDNAYAQYDGVVRILAPALGAVGLEALKGLLLVELQRFPKPQKSKAPRSLSGFEEDYSLKFREREIRSALQEIADAQGDVEGFLAQYDEAARRIPGIAAQIALRMLGANRAQEALKTLEQAAPPARPGSWPDFSWENARIEALEALGRKAEAQAARRSCFERALSVEHLRVWLRKLPEFEDFEAEQKAFDHAAGFRSFPQALEFFLSWPALDRAEALILKRAKELDGNHYGLFAPAAESLSAKHPLAASLALRAMIDFTLTQSRSTRYKHAARHLTECAALAGSVVDFGDFETHEAYVGRLRKAHGRKAAFWDLVK